MPRLVLFSVLLLSFCATSASITATGEALTRLGFPGPTAFLRFTLDGKKLFVLR
jgi:hypothetical protein